MHPVMQVDMIALRTIKSNNLNYIIKVYEMFVHYILQS